jgi:hypothetical protein
MIVLIGSRRIIPVGEMDIFDTAASRSIDDDG